jgi:hypothetical protein
MKLMKEMKMKSMIPNSEKQRQITRFIQLKTKTDGELRAIADNLTLNTELTGSALIQAIVRAEATPQIWNQPQAFAIKTRGKDPEAEKFVRMANSRILPQDPNTGSVIRDRMKQKLFKFTNRDGKSYDLKCAYIELKQETAAFLVATDWLDPLDTQVKLLELLRKDSSRFTCTLIRKQDAKKKHYLMLHVEPAVVN